MYELICKCGLSVENQKIDNFKSKLLDIIDKVNKSVVSIKHNKTYSLIDYKDEYDFTIKITSDIQESIRTMSAITRHLKKYNLKYDYRKMILNFELVDENAYNIQNSIKTIMI